MFPEDTLKASEHRAKRLLEDPKAYLRFGPYCWAVKRLLNATRQDCGPMTNDMADECTPDSPELKLLAAWKFAEDYIRAYGVQTNEYDLDGRTFLLYAPDQAQPKA